MPDVRTAAQNTVALQPLDARFPVPDYPPRAWFTELPDWYEPGMKLTVDDDGRVAGDFYTAGQCLVHMPDACPRPSPTRYAAFTQNVVVTADGETLDVGVIGNTHGHADPMSTIGGAQRHYADPSAQLMSVRAYDFEHGGVVLGALVPGVTFDDVALIRRSALSGDWRPMPAAWWKAHGIQANVVRDCDGYDCIGPTLVTRPGLPLIRVFQGGAMLGGMGGVQLDNEPEELMGETRIETPDGIVVTTTGAKTARAAAPVGPQPIQAADAPPFGGNDTSSSPDTTSSDTTSSDTVTRDEFDALDARVAALESMLDQSMAAELAAIDAQVAALPARPGPH